jgi:hypothetical protein
MEPEVITLSEISQTQKDKYHMLSFICGNKKVDLTEEWSRIVATRH